LEPCRQGEAGQARKAAPLALDLEDALDRMDGDGVLLSHLLGQFAETHANSAQEILDSLDQRDLATAARVAHTLKGSAANLGAKALAAAAESLLRTARADDSEGSLALLVAVRRHLNAVFRDIEELRPRLAAQGGAVFGDGHSNSGGHLDRGSLNTHLRTLDEMLRCNNMAAADAFAGVQSALEAAYGKASVAGLARLIQRLDFPGAVCALKQIVNDAEMDQGKAPFALGGDVAG
jgi:HPt (histidine-containing phosphotransfer) domain-containing protein